MVNNIKIIISIFLIFIFFGWGHKLAPSRLEITDLEATQVIGLDSSEENGVKLSLAVEERGESKGASKGNEDSKEKIISISGKTFASCVKGLQNYNDKIFIGGHVRDIIIGEEMAKDNLVRSIDFLSKSSEIRLNGKVYICKQSTAEDLLNNSLSSSYTLADRMSSLVINNKNETQEKGVELIDVMNILISESKNGVIPCVELIENGDWHHREFQIINKSKDEKRAELVGYGIIKDAKLVGFLDIQASDGYNFLTNRSSKAAINVERNGEIIGLTGTKFKTNISFKFDKDTLKEVVVKTNISNTISESSFGSNIFKEDISTLEGIIEDEVKSRVQKTVECMKFFDVDFMKLGEILEIKHPYKWHRIKNDWENIFINVPITIEVKSKINRTYDVLSIVNDK